jgi:hypothetical protein
LEIPGELYVNFGVVFMKSEWITYKYPDPYKKVLIFDLIDGVHLGFYDKELDTFFTTDNYSLNYVAGWVDIPSSTPVTTRTIRDNVFSLNNCIKVVGLPTNSSED